MIRSINPVRRTGLMIYAFVLYGVSVSTGQLLAQDSTKSREPIGQAFGKTVYRDEIRTGKGISERDELSRLFIRPVMQKYREEHKAEVEPSDAEIDATAAYFEQQHRERMKTEGPKIRQEIQELKAKKEKGQLSEDEKLKLERRIATVESELDPPDRLFAKFMLDNWKFQRHLYDKFGGGRILWQQAGTEAFDAMRKFLETSERAGEFRIDDPEIRAKVYAYWTTQKHGSFLTSDPKRIESFLNPEWVPKKK
jgi:hypothetical protein